MKKFLRKNTILLMALSMVLSFTIQADAIDFSKNEAYYESLCFTTAAKENASVCRAFQDYINKKAADSRNQLTTIREQMKDVKSNILQLTQQIAKYEEDITELERQIRVLSDSIYRMEANIRVLEDQIVRRENDVEVRDEAVKERLVMMQGFMTVNGYVDFIMGASSFTDLIRRVEGINDISAYDREQIRLLKLEIERIEQDKVELERQKSALEDNRQNLVLTQETVEGLKQSIEEIVAEYRRQEADLMNKESEIVSNLSEIQKQFEKVAAALNAIAPSSGWIRPITSGFRISAGVWAYPGGGLHLGTDFAAPVGTPLVAVANGVIVYRADSCPTWGYLGNSCGYPGASMGGNQIQLVVSVNNRTYAISYNHLQSGSVAGPIGRVVAQGELIGRVGSSGNSSGPHLHIEVMYLGTMSIQQYVSRWNGDLSFGTRWGTSGLSTRCSVNGNSPPCRMNPQEVFGVNVGSNY